MSQPASPARRPSTARGGVASRDLLAVVGLVVGSLVVPVAGWLVGVALLWRSRTWTVGEKLLGTLVWPGGLLLPLALPFLPFGVRLLTSPALAMTVISVLVLTPMAVGAHLLRRAGRGSHG
jgi:hypothetical protein